MNKVQSGVPLVVGEVTITPVERVERRHTIDERGLFVSFSKKPVGVTVDSPVGSWVFDLEDWNPEAPCVWPHRAANGEDS